MYKKVILLLSCIFCTALFCSCDAKDQTTESTMASAPLDNTSSALSVTSAQSTETVPPSIISQPDSSPVASEPLMYTITEPKFESTASLPEVMYETVNGKKIEFKFDKVVEPQGMQLHDRLSYVSDEGDVAQYDKITGQLLQIIIDTDISPELNETLVSEEEAVKIAEAFIKQHCDLSKYRLNRVNYNEFIGTIVDYAKFMSGYRTSNGISVIIALDGTIHAFFYDPYVFDNITIKNIDESVLMRDLDSQIKAYHGDNMLQYEITDKRLVLAEDKKTPQMEYYVNLSLNRRGEIVSSAEVFYCTLK